MSRVYFYLCAWPVLEPNAYSLVFHIALIHQYGVYRLFTPMHQLTLVTIRATGSPLYIDTHIALCLGCSVEQKLAINLSLKNPSLTQGFWAVGSPRHLLFHKRMLANGLTQACS